MCIIEGCDRPIKIMSRGWCGTHYSRWQRTGSTDTVRRAPNGTSLTERFWSKVDRRGPDECWLWTAGTQQPYGHGALWDNGRMVGAHRVSWLLHYGPAPRGKWILHRCDVPLCVNPRHLYLGASERNVRDCFERGRSPYQKLTVEQVQAIRASITGTYGEQAALARAYGVTRSAIGDIVRGRRWAWVEQPDHLPSTSRSPAASTA